MESCPLEEIIKTWNFRFVHIPLRDTEKKRKLLYFYTKHFEC